MPWELNGNTGAGNFLGTTDNTPLVLKTNDTAKVQVDPTGNVGIGTTSPRSILEVDVPATGVLGPVVTLTNTGGQANAAAAIDFNTFSPSSAGVYNPSSRIEAVDRGNYVNDIVFSSNKPGAANNGLVEKMRIFGAPLGLQVNEGLIVSGPATITGGIVTNGLAIGPQPNDSVLLEGSAGKLVIGDPAPNFVAIGINMTTPQADLHLRDGGALRIGVGGVFRMEGASAAGEGAVGENAFFSFGGNGAFGIDAPGRPNGRFVVLDNGNVGIGVAAPTHQLDVAGDVAVSGDVLLTGADCAEQFDVRGSQPPEVGTVVVIDEGGALRESREAYDKKVAGVVSGAGEYKHALLLDRRESDKSRIPVALVGKVYCKVDAQYSPIEVGDLLTTSPTDGHAMKAADPVKAFGCVIGKALKSLEAGKGLIPILVALQ